VPTSLGWPYNKPQVLVHQLVLTQNILLWLVAEVGVEPLVVAVELVVLEQALHF
jgi:hypothetical protein